LSSTNTSRRGKRNTPDPDCVRFASLCELWSISLFDLVSKNTWGQIHLMSVGANILYSRSREDSEDNGDKKSKKGKKYTVSELKEMKPEDYERYIRSCGGG
jgi:uncharacterized protein (UPF0128 family)